MKKKTLKKATALVLGAGLLTSSLSAFYPSSPTVVHATTNTTAVQILSKLTPEQRQALEKLSANDQSGLFLDPKVNLVSAESVSVIVQFKNMPEHTAVLEAALEGRILSSNQAKENVNDDHTAFKQDLGSVFTKESDGTYKVIREYKNAFNGVALEVPANKIEEIMKSSVVQAIFSNSTIKAEPPSAEDATPSSDPQGLGMAAELNFLNINKLHNEGYTGKGVKVAVLDTGVDYNHPDIKAAFKGGYDFIDNDSDPMETTYQDYLNYKKANPSTLKASDYETEHGTHVSGTIVGQGKNNSPYATNGIAPDAELYVYRVLGPGGSGSDETVMAGIERAVADGMNVMNLSLGANNNDPLYPTSIAINNAVLSGITAVVAAGNSGDRMYTLGSPGSASLALTVGASDVPQTIPTMKGQLDSVNANMRGLAKGWNSDFSTFQGQALNIVNIPNYGAANDYRNLDVAGKVVLVQRGNGQTINDKILQAKLKGAAAILIWNNNPTEGYMPFYLGEGVDFIPSFNLTNADGLALQQKIVAGNSQFSFTDLGSLTTPGDNLASFSSRGPSRVTYDIKPEITAPGVNVLSTVPGFVHNHDNPSDYTTAYERMSGTSMATPNVTGIAALLLQAKPDLTPDDVKAILMNTADSLSKPYSVFEQGAGRVNPYEAIHSSIEIKVKDKAPTITNGKERKMNENTGALSFGNVAFNGKNINDAREVTIENKGTEAKIFDVKVTFQSSVRGAKDAAQNGVELNTDLSVKVPTNSHVTRNVTLSIPTSAEKGIYEGYIVYTNHDDPSETYRVPFGVHYVEEGIQSYDYDWHRTTTVRNHLTNLIFDPTMPGHFTLKSHMRYLYQIITDADGNEIGVTSGYDGIGINEGVEYNTSFNGSYYPFTGDDDNPIDFRLRLAPEGHYKLKMVGYNDEGNAFTSTTTDMVIDNTMPDAFDVHLDGEKEGNPFVEYEPGTKSIPVTAFVHDKEIADQSKNFLFYSYNSYFMTGSYSLDQNGQYKGTVALPTNGQLLDLQFEGVDPAANTFGRKYYFVVPNNYTYVYAKPNVPMRQSYVFTHIGDTVTFTLTANHVNNLKQAAYRFMTRNNDTLIKKIALNPAAQQLGATLSYTSTPQAGNATLNNVNVSFNGISADTIPMVDVTIQIPNMTDYNDSSSITNSVTSTFTSVDGKVTRPFSWVPPTGILPNFSAAYGSIHPEVFQDANGKLKSQDYTKIGAKVTVVDSQGNTYDGVLNKYGGFSVNGLPITHDRLTLIQDIPGHFTRYDQFGKVYRTLDGMDYGDGKTLSYPNEIGDAAAGDANKDNVIDIQDALAVQASFGAHAVDANYNRNADINGDGVIDAKDFAYVEKNFGMQNPTIDNSPKPVNQMKGKTLADIKKELGL
ncbi:S8 family serine peptidase [Neobacillus sp. 204]|uniref:S8 family serine peptidase n=1 Tax=Neobacillus sp. 204 TaxID=3383351 RepID=UPI00397C59A2